VNDRATIEALDSTFSTTADTSGCPAGCVGKFSFVARLPNITTDSISKVQILVTTLSDGNFLQNADGGPSGVGAILTVPQADDYSDGILSPGEFVDVTFVICLTQKEPFTFFVDLLGIVQ
jgi:hypothetical protein